MEIFLTIELTKNGYLTKIEQLSNFNVTFSKNDDDFNSFPSVLKKFVLEWELENNTTSKFHSEFPTIQRIKSRSFYQASMYRIKEMIDNNSANPIDLEHIHSINQEDFISLFAEIPTVN